VRDASTDDVPREDLQRHEIMAIVAIIERLVTPETGRFSGVSYENFPLP
jgi:hypothetical protein